MFGSLFEKFQRREEENFAVAQVKGVFINPALTEPLGVTLLEAAATGLPLVATEKGGRAYRCAASRNGQR